VVPFEGASLVLQRCFTDGYSLKAFTVESLAEQFCSLNGINLLLTSLATGFAEKQLKDTGERCAT